jgi:hypothetical protein
MQRGDHDFLLTVHFFFFLQVSFVSWAGAWVHGDQAFVIWIWGRYLFRLTTMRF